MYFLFWGLKATNVIRSTSTSKKAREIQKMDLETFIKQTLLDIGSGVIAAQEELGAMELESTKRSTGTHVVPRGLRNAESTSAVSSIQSIEFDILVSVQETKGKEAKIGVLNSFVGAGLGSNSENEASHSSRLKFRVPIRFREHPVPKES